MSGLRVVRIHPMAGGEAWRQIEAASKAADKAGEPQAIRQEGHVVAVVEPA